MKYRPIITDSSLRELTMHGSEAFPMSMDEQIVYDRGCNHIKHWHDEIQINLVTKGAVIFSTPEGQHRISAGECFFINSATLHEVIPTEIVDSIYQCVNFLPDLIYGQLNNRLRQYYLDPMINCTELKAFPLRNEIPWQRQICKWMTELGEINEARKYGHELLSLDLICRILHSIIINNQTVLEKYASISSSDKQRIQQLEQFIHDSYTQKIRLSDIANAAHISEGECCRLFKRVEHMSPITYMTRYRIRKSLPLLSNTDMSISDIAYSTGFSSSSYYTECFKRIMHINPSSYRKNAK